MSDVITLDSSDEESPPVVKKPKLNIQVKKPVSGPQVPQNVGPQRLPKKSTPVNVPIQIASIANSTPKIQTLPIAFSDELRKKVRNIVSGIRGGHAPINIRPILNPKAPPCNIAVQNQGGSLLQPIRAVNQRNKISNVPIRSQSNINPMNRNNLPSIFNARTLQNAQKKPAAQNVINALPAGITVTRTSGPSAKKVPTQKPLMRNVMVKNPLSKNTRQPPKVMETVELDDDEDDLGGSTNVVGSQIPIEFDSAETEELQGDDTKENSLFVIEVPPKDPDEEKQSESEEKTYELMLTNGDELDNASDDVSNDQETSTSLEEPKSLDVTEEVELAIESDPLKMNLSFYTPKKSESKELPKVTHNDNVKKVMESFIEILDSPVKTTTLDEINTVKEDIMTIKEESTVGTKTMDDKEVDFPIPSPKKDIIVFIPDTAFSRILDEEKPGPVIKEVNVKVNISLKDVLEVEEYIKKSPRKIAPTPVVEPERQINKTYQSLIDLCFKLDKSDDMKKIIEKKVKAYYFSVQPSFTESKSFCKFVQEKVEEMSSNPDSLFLYIKDVVDELKVRRVKNKKNLEDGLPDKSPCTRNPRIKDLQEPGTGGTESEGGDSHDEEEDSVTNQRIYKLERAMRKLNKAIKKLDEREIEDDDEEDSAYMLGDKYKSRLLRIYKKLCVLTGERDEARQLASMRGLSRLSLCGGRLPRLSAAVKAAAAAKPHWFPDYLDVYKCVEHCAKEQGLTMRPDMLHTEAREAFLEIGTLLQQHRRAQEYEDLSWRLGMHSDPAEQDPELAAKLTKNRELFKHREMEVLNKFAEKQSNLKLMAEDVAENEADKSEGSSGESEEEDMYDNKENDEGEATSPVKDTTDKSKEGSSSSGDEHKKETVTNRGDKTGEEPGQEAKNESEENTNPVGDSQLEKQTIIKEQPRKRKFREDSNDSSSMSLIELSSSDSLDSLKSEPGKKIKFTESDRDFKRLESIRPTSAMSGINLIEDGSSSSSRFASNKDSNDVIMEHHKFKSGGVKDSSDVIMEVEDSNDVSEAPSKPAREDVRNHVDDNAVHETEVQNLVDNDNSVDLGETEKTDECEDVLSRRGGMGNDFCTKDSLEVIDNDVIENNDSCSLSNEPNQIKIGHVQSLQNHIDPDEARCPEDTETIDNDDDGCDKPDQIKIGQVHSLQNHDNDSELNDNDDLLVQNDDGDSLSNEPNQIKIVQVQSSQDLYDINNLLEARCSEVSEIGDEVHAINVLESDDKSDLETDSETLALFYDEKDSEGTDDVDKTVVPNGGEVAADTDGVVGESSSDCDEIPDNQSSKTDKRTDNTVCDVASDKNTQVEASKNSEVDVKESEEDQGIYEGEIDIFEHEITGAV